MRMKAFLKYRSFRKFICTPPIISLLTSLLTAPASSHHPSIFRINIIKMKAFYLLQYYPILSDFFKFAQKDTSRMEDVCH